jgi:hypothetical protein
VGGRGQFERKVLPVAMVLIALLLLITCICLAAGEDMPGVVLAVKRIGEGKAVLQPMLPVQLEVEVVERGPDGSVAAQGDVITCRAFRRVRNVVELENKAPMVVGELALDCGGRIYVVKGVLFSK